MQKRVLEIIKTNHDYRASASKIDYCTFMAESSPLFLVSSSSLYIGNRVTDVCHRNRLLYRKLVDMVQIDWLKSYLYQNSGVVTITLVPHLSFEYDMSVYLDTGFRGFTTFSYK